jgi:hypothetical protein
MRSGDAVAAFARAIASQGQVTLSWVGDIQENP